jgi:hypothetical protein
MAVWAQIRRTSLEMKVRKVVESDSRPNGIDWVDVSSYPVIPSPGQFYDETSDSFTFRPKVPVKLSKFQFMSRFTDNEKRSIMQLIKDGDLDVTIFYEMLRSADEVDITHPSTSEGLMVLVSKGILASERVDEILSV